MDLLKTAPRSEVNALHKQRVWFALSYSSSRRSPPIRRRAIAAMAVLSALLGITAVASAARGHWPEWAVRAYERLLPASVSTSSESPRPTRGMEKRGGASQGTAPMNVAAASVALAPTGGSDRNRQRPSAEGYGLPAGRARRATSRLPSVASRDAIGVTDESRPVLAALRALRREHDPVLARALLRQYLGEHPEGTLAEEALAITIEAALVHHDADANALGRRYLDRYPHGPFRALADHARGVGDD